MYDLDRLLDITTDYLDHQDLLRYLPTGNEEVEMSTIAARITEDIGRALLDPLPPELNGTLFYAYDLWDLTVYLRNRYHLNSREELVYTYYLKRKEEE